MASIRREIVIDVGPDAVWDAVRDWGALHTRLVPGFVTDCRRDGNDRIVTFFNGATVRERIVSCDDDTRRLVWSIIEGPYAHHNGSVEVFGEDSGRTRFVWTTDLLPDELEARTGDMMGHGLETIRSTLSDGKIEAGR